MAGIAPQPQQQPQDDPDSQGQQGPDEVGDEEGLQPNVSPEEQQAYNKFVLGGMMYLYQPKEGNQPPQVRPAILKLLDNDHSDLKAILKLPMVMQGGPLVAIAATSVIVFMEVMKKVGPEDGVSDDVALHGAVAILEDVCEIWMRANPGQQLGEDEVHRALSIAAGIYEKVGTDAGLVDPNALKQQFAQLVQADRSGNLASVSPDLAGINAAAQYNAQHGVDVPSPGQDQGQDQDQQQGQQQEAA